MVHGLRPALHGSAINQAIPQQAQRLAPRLPRLLPVAATSPLAISPGQDPKGQRSP